MQLLVHVHCAYLLLPGLLNDVDLLGGRVEARVVVEQVGHEGQVQDLLPVHHVLVK